MPTLRSTIHSKVVICYFHMDCMTTVFLKLVKVKKNGEGRAKMNLHLEKPNWDSSTHRVHENVTQVL